MAIWRWPHENRRSETMLFAHAGWWLVNPYRTGQEFSALIPMLQVGLTVSGDVL